MCGFYCSAFIYVGRKTLLDYCNLLFPNDYKKMTKKIYKYFTDKHVKS